MGPKAATRKATTTTAKKVVTVEERIRRHFGSLCAQIDANHFRNAIKTCDKILRLEAKDVDALQAKLFLLLQTEQYDQAISMIKEAPTDYDYEVAYSLYRQHQEDKAEEMLEKLKTSGKGQDRGVLHLDAQLNYRRGSYQKAMDVYNELLNTCPAQSEEYSDTLTNLTAAQTHLDFLTSGFQRSLHTLPIETLEAKGPLTVPTSVARVVVEERPTTTTKRRVRMSRVPKGVVPGVTPGPDPERWLKKSERTNVTKSRKKGAGGATQGSVTEAQSEKKQGKTKKKR